MVMNSIYEVYYFFIHTCCKNLFLWNMEIDLGLVSAQSQKLWDLDVGRLDFFRNGEETHEKHSNTCSSCRIASK